MEVSLVTYLGVQSAGAGAQWAGVTRDLPGWYQACLFPPLLIALSIQVHKALVYKPIRTLSCVHVCTDPQCKRQACPTVYSSPAIKVSDTRDYHFVALSAPTVTEIEPAFVAEWFTVSIALVSGKDIRYT